MPVVSDPSVLSRSVALFEVLTDEQLSRLNTLLYRKTLPACSNLMAAGQTRRRYLHHSQRHRQLSPSFD